MVRPRKAIRFFLLAAICTPVFVLHRVALRLDDWLYPSLRDVQITRPLFIVGLPRSGTTLLHRLIANDRGVFTTMPLWELLLAPAVCEKRFFRRLRTVDGWLGRPLWRILCAVQQRASRSIQDVHATTLHSPEEDFLALLPFGGCFLKVICFPESEDVWKLGSFCDQLAPSRQQKLVATYKRILQRHLYFRGKHFHLLSKNPSLTSWVPALAEEFPDACFVGLRRAPEQSVPSQLSSLRSSMAFFGTDVAEPEIVDRFVNLLSSYWRTLDQANEVLPSTRFRLIEYDSLVGDSYPTVRSTLDQFGYSLSAQGRAALQKACFAQREYRSSHRYCLEEFGLNRERLEFVFESFSKCSAPHPTNFVSPAMP